MGGLLNNAVLIFWTAVTLIATVPVVSYYWWKIRQAQIDADLKRDMIAVGMSAEEIERVLATENDGDAEDSSARKRHELQ